MIHSATVLLTRFFHSVLSLRFFRAKLTLFSKFWSTTIVAHNGIIAKLVVDLDLAAQLAAIAVDPNRTF